MTFRQELLMWILGIRKAQICIRDHYFIYALKPLAGTSIIYVGSTKQEIETRVRAHLTDAKKGAHKNKKLQAAILKHNFFISYVVLEVCHSDNVYERENYWIREMSKRNNLLNIRNPEKPFVNLNSVK